MLKNFISVHDVTDINALVSKAMAYKKDPLIHSSLGKGKRVGCLFLNPSMRTRLSTQVAAQNLGMDAVIFNVGAEGWAMEFEDGAIMNGSSVEHVKDAAPVLGKYFDILAIRTFPLLKNREEDYSEKFISQFIKYAGIPVISLESATLHPLQSLTDVMTIKECMPAGKRPKVVLTWAPHIKPLPQCVSNSFAQWVNAWSEADLFITHPQGYELDEKYTRGATVTDLQDVALRDADFVYVKNWSAYHNYGEILSSDLSWMLTLEKLKQTAEAKVMHCLPVRRNIELSDEVLDSAHSIVTTQAANRVWAAQAVLSEILHA